jgi:uncharacterized peroxidase-related enzyme
MAWIRIIAEDEATGELNELYKEVGAAGLVANIYKIHSLNPASLRSHLQLYRTLLFGKSDLSRIQREMIGVVVSTANRCRY